MSYGSRPRGSACKGEEPTVSVVIPCFNQGRFLPDAVRSVTEQIFDDWECLIVNDGSPDDTSAVATALIAAYPGRRICLCEKANGGVADARNYGIKRARGRYILPLDADDLLHPEMLSRTVQVLDRDPEVAIAYVDMVLFGAEQRLAVTGRFDLDVLKYSNPLPYCSLYRRQLWESLGGYKVDMVPSGYVDWDFWVGAGERGVIARHLQEAFLFFYRVKSESMYTEALKYDTHLKAQIVCNHPKIYNAQERLWALEVIAQALPRPKVAAAAEHLLNLEGVAVASFSESWANGMDFLGWVYRTFPGDLKLKQWSNELAARQFSRRG